MEKGERHSGAGLDNSGIKQGRRRACAWPSKRCPPPRMAIRFAPHEFLAMAKTCFPVIRIFRKADIGCADVIVAKGGELLDGVFHG